MEICYSTGAGYPRRHIGNGSAVLKVDDPCSILSIILQDRNITVYACNSIQETVQHITRKPHSAAADILFFANSIESRPQGSRDLVAWCKAINFAEICLLLGDGTVNAGFSLALRTVNH